MGQETPATPAFEDDVHSSCDLMGATLEIELKFTFVSLNYYSLSFSFVFLSFTFPIYLSSV